MKFVTYACKKDKKPRFGFVKANYIFDILYSGNWLNSISGNSNFTNLPSSLKEALGDWWNNLEQFIELEKLLSLDKIESKVINGKIIALPISEANLFAPVYNPQSFRDFYAFEQHVRAARKLRGLEMNPDWYKLAIFYFSNPNCCYGHGANIPYPRNTTELDFELEFAVIIGNGGKDIKANEADKVIAGYTILNDWSSRNLQREEMPMSLGPAKGKDFASSFGPYMVTPDELEDAWEDDGKLHLNMACYVNDKKISKGNTNDLYHSFGTMIERASMNAKLVPGEYLGSGTVGTGCILELRPENTGGWLKKGDVVRMEIEKLGVLENKII